MLVQTLTLNALLLGPAVPPNSGVSPLAHRDDTSGRLEPATPRIGALGITGATMVTTSLAVLIAGSVNLTARVSSPYFDYELGYMRGSGRALVGLGIVGATAGITALAFDLAFRSHGRGRRGVGVHADVSPTGGGLWLTGRF